MKKIFFAFILFFLCSNNAYAESYFFKNCKLSNAVVGNYIINLEKNVIEVELKRQDGVVQNFADKIKTVEKNKIVSEKIKSGKSKELYYQYFLNSDTQTVTKLEYIKQGGADLNVYKLSSKRRTRCLDVKSDWDKEKIDKAKVEKEQEEILKAQEELKKEQEKIFECQGNDISKWKDCKGSYKSETGHEYKGMFKDGKIIKGISLYPGGSKYVGEFINFKPDGYGTFLYANGDRYYGNWKNGTANGEGTKLWSDGREYAGTFKNDKLHGNGNLYFPDGKKYEGEFKNGKRNGQGIYTKHNSWKYEGEWKNGEKNGLGKFTSSDGINYNGGYKEGLFNGKGTYNWADGRKLVGDFKDGSFWQGKEYNKFGKIVGIYVKGVFQNK